MLGRPVGLKLDTVKERARSAERRRNSVLQAFAPVLLTLLLVASAQGLSLSSRSADHVISNAVAVDNTTAALDLRDSVLIPSHNAGATVISASGFVLHKRKEFA